MENDLNPVFVTILRSPRMAANLLMKLMRGRTWPRGERMAVLRVQTEPDAKVTLNGCAPCYGDTLKINGMPPAYARLVREIFVGFLTQNPCDGALPICSNLGGTGRSPSHGTPANWSSGILSCALIFPDSRHGFSGSPRAGTHGIPRPWVPASKRSR